MTRKTKENLDKVMQKVGKDENFDGDVGQMRQGINGIQGWQRFEQ